MNIRTQTFVTHLLCTVMLAITAWGCAHMALDEAPARVIDMPPVIITARDNPAACFYVTDGGLFVDACDTCPGVDSFVWMPITAINNP